MKKELFAAFSLTICTLFLFSILSSTVQASFLSEINNKTQEIQNKQINIPDPIEFILTKIFKIQEPITFIKFILFIIILLLVFYTIYIATTLMPLFEKPLIRLISSICITLLATITGTLNLFLNFWLDKNIIWIIIGLVIIFIILKLIASYINNQIEAAKAQGNVVKGLKAGFWLKMSKIFSGTNSP